ncbi:Pyruvate/2-oxoacid:ferredoxin oxidoreductase gamma subunit [Bradyrhizobium sp. LM2.7]
MASLQTEVNSGVPESAIWKTRGVDVEKLARIVIGGSITVNVVASMGTFNAALLPAEFTNLQQAIALLMRGAS